MSSHPQPPPSLILITGASRGIGAYLATKLHDIADQMVLCARNLEQLQEVASRVRQEGIKVHCIAADLCIAADREKLVKQLHIWGQIKYVIHNAGVEYPIPFAEQSTQQIEQQLTLNTYAPILLTKALLAPMLDHHFGRVVFISSMSGKSPTPFNSIYAASKFAINGFVNSAAMELQGSGVHLGVVCPSFVATTGMWADTGLRAPALLREVKVERVYEAVKKVLLGQKTEVLVTPTPVRPMLAIYAIFPSLGQKMLNILGVWKILQKRADFTRKKHKTIDTQE